MCRWLGYSGGAIRIEQPLFEPGHSLTDQSLAARTGPSTTNGEGFGLEPIPLTASCSVAKVPRRADAGPSARGGPAPERSGRRIGWAGERSRC